VVKDIQLRLLWAAVDRDDVAAHGKDERESRPAIITQTRLESGTAGEVAKQPR